jgi:O-antigen/teichoic acid export membrane protein
VVRGGNVGSSSEVKVPNLEPPKPEAQFQTDHLLQDIGRRAISAGFVTIGAQGAKFLASFAAAATLSRLLSPKDFGLVGMVLGVTGLVAVFMELGLSTATVQRKDITQEQVSNLFWINVAFGTALALICAAVAPLVARFYRDPHVTNIMLALSASFLLTSSAVQHRALLARQMRFREIAVIDVTSISVGVASACFLAWYGIGYWALVAQQLVTALVALVMTWMRSGWRPQRPTRNSHVTPLVKFGAHISAADFVSQFALNSDSILIGRIFGAIQLGFYTRAYVLLARPLQQVIMPVNSVLIPVLSRLQNDPPRYRRSYMRAYDTLALFVFSFAAVCIVLARPMVLVILGPRWAGVIPLFAAFTLVGIAGPLTSVVSWIYESQARGKDQLQNHTLAGIVTVLSYLAGLPWGPIGLILAVAISNLLIRMPIVYHLAGRKGPVTTGDLWFGFWSHVPCWGTVFISTFLIHKTVENMAPIVQLLVCAPLGTGVGIALALIFPRPRRSIFFALRTLRNAVNGRFTPEEA